MTDYTKTTDFTSKDSLPSGDSGKIIRGAEFGTEFDNIQTAVNSKSNINNPSFTGNITVTGTVDGRDIATDGTKLDTIETSADVTDTTNVTAAGALMDSEVTNLAQVKAFDSADYATAAQGTTADAALPRTGGAMTGAITTNSTFDGRDVATDGTKLDGIEALADVTDTTNVTAAGALMDSELTNITAVKALNQGVATTDTPTFAGLATTADVSFGDNDKAIFGAGSDLQIYHEPNNSIVKESGGGSLLIQGDNIRLQKVDGTENMLTAVNDGQLKLFYDGAEKLATTSTGIDVTGNATFADNGKAIFGTDSDMSLFHNGNNAFLDNDTGTLFIQTDSFSVKNATGTESLMLGTADGAVTLYHNNLAKLATSSTGIDVTGTIVSDGLTVQGASDSTVLVEATGGNDASLFLTEAGTGNVGAQFVYDGGSNELFLKVGNNTNTNRLSVSRDTGDISFYEDTGTTAKFFWDSSAESLGLGTSSPSSVLHLSTSNDPKITLTDTGFGASADITGSNGNLRLNSQTATLFDMAGSEVMRIDSSGNLLVGTTTTTAGNEGMVYFNGSSLRVTRDSDEPLNLDRLTTDGDIAVFKKGGTTVGSIGTISSDLEIHSTVASHVGIRFGNGGIFPTDNTGTVTNGAADIGASTLRFKDLYLSGVAKVDSYVSLGNNGYIRGDASGELRFQGGSSATTFYNSDNTAERMRIDSSGHVGIAHTDFTNFSGKLVVADGSVGGSSFIDIHNNNNNQFVKIGINNNTALIAYDNADEIAFGQMADASNTSLATEHMRIDVSGNVLVGTTSTTDSAKFSVLSSGTAASFRTTPTTATSLIIFRNGNGLVGSISTNGSTTAFNTSSDQRLKDNIVDAPSASDDIDAIQVRSFDWKVDGSHQKYGMVAQELQSVAPEAVSEGETEDDMMGVDYSKLVPMLVKEIQSLRARVAQLETN